MKVCPFCGGKGRIKTDLASHWIECDDCEATGPVEIMAKALKKGGLPLEYQPYEYELEEQQVPPNHIRVDE